MNGPHLSFITSAFGNKSGTPAKIDLLLFFISMHQPVLQSQSHKKESIRAHNLMDSVLGNCLCRVMSHGFMIMLQFFPVQSLSIFV